MKDKEKQYISMKEMLTKRSFEPITNCNCVEETRYAVRKNEDNAGTMTDLLNQEIEELQKALKEKQIEEMAKLLNDKNASIVYWDYYNDDYNPSYKKELKNVASIIYNAGYRKIPEDSIVLSKEEFKEKIKQVKDLEKNYYKNVLLPQSRKETAEKFYEKEKLKQFAEMLIEKKVKLGDRFNIYDIDETLKEFIK